MIVALDSQLAVGTSTGIGEYVTGLAAALAARGLGVVQLREPRLDPWRFDRRFVWDQILLPRLAANARADILHCASGTMPGRSRLPVVVTVHDVVWLRGQKHARAYARWYFGSLMRKRYAHAQAIAVDSEFSRRELLDAVPLPEGRVHVAYPGVSQDFFDLQRRPPGEQLIFSPGTVEPRKNLEVVIRALARIPQARLVSAGPFTPYRNRCEVLARECGVADRVTFLGYLSRVQLLELYARCALVAVPSVYEGFGYVAAQALCAGVPLVVSNASSLPEIAGNMAPAIPPADPQAWTQAIERVLADPKTANDRAAQLRPKAQARFTWGASAAKMEAVYQSVL